MLRVFVSIPTEHAMFQFQCKTVTVKTT